MINDLKAVHTQRHFEYLLCPHEQPTVCMDKVVPTVREDRSGLKSKMRRLHSLLRLLIMGVKIMLLYFCNGGNVPLFWR